MKLFDRWTKSMLVALVALLALTEASEAQRKYVKTKAGERPRPVVAVDNVCAWPNLTVAANSWIAACLPVT